MAKSQILTAAHYSTHLLNMITTSRSRPGAPQSQTNLKRQPCADSQSSIVKSPLRILHLESDPNEAPLVRLNLEAGGIACTITRVESQEDFLGALERGGIDLILADRSGPGFDGILAAEIAHTRWPDIPVILLSDTLGEELTEGSIRSGATDCVLKECLVRLAPAVQRAMRDVNERDRRQLHEAQTTGGQEPDVAGQLAGRIIHDFNNILTFIASYSDLLALVPGSEEQVRKHAGEIRSASERAAGLTGQLRTLSRNQTLQPGAVDLNDVAEELNLMLRRLVDDNAEIGSPEHTSAGSRPTPAMSERRIRN